MKIIFAYLCDYADRDDYYQSLLPIGILALASFVEQNGHQAVVMNLSHHGHKKGAEEILKEGCDLLGLSIYTHNRLENHKLISLLAREKRSFGIVLGGPHVSFLADEYLKRFPSIDYIVQGEGEAGILEAIRLKQAASSRVVIQPRRVNLAELPAPTSFSGSMKWVNPNEQFKYIVTSRGCPHCCRYCSSPSFWSRNTTFRSVDSIIDEIEDLKNRYGIIYFGIRDDNFTLKKSRVLEFSSKLIERKIGIMWNCQSRVDTIDLEMLCSMKAAGLEHIQFGVESGSEKILALYDKKITPEKIYEACDNARKAGVYLSIYLMTGMDGETRSDVDKTKALIKRVLPGDVLLSPVAYYPGTAIYENARKEHRISDSVWFSPPQGLYLKNDGENEKRIYEILNYAAALKDKAWYKDKDFVAQRKLNGDSDWVGEILYGDYCLDCDRVEDAINCYLRAERIVPWHPWPKLRLGKGFFYDGEYSQALDYYQAVVKLVPRYYGAWLKSAESAIPLGRLDDAQHFILKAKSLNSFDPRVANVERSIKKLRSRR